MLSSIFQSYMVQLILTAALGAALYYLIPRSTIILKILCWSIAIGIIVSALFIIGEVNIYGTFYRRAFFYYGDEITTVTVFLFLWSVIRKDQLPSIFLFSAILLSGGKASLIFFMIATSALFYIHDGIWRRKSAKIIMVSSTTGLIVYMSVVTISSFMQHQNILEKYSTKDNIARGLKSSPNHTSECRTVERCFQTQVARSLHDRYLSSLAGLWMTLEGGFPGRKFPNKPEQFAKLMMDNNPWGINDRYKINFLEWEKIRKVQNPYLAFGAGYGPWLLSGLLLVFIAISFIALKNLLAGEIGEAALLSIAFITIAIFNQTQSWLSSGSIILVMMGYFTAHILTSWILRKQFFSNLIIYKLFPNISGQMRKA